MTSAKGETMDTDLTIGQRIQIRRRGAGMRQRELATAAGMSRSYLCDLEKDRGKNPSARTLHAIAGALGVRAGYLLSGVQPSPRPENGVAAMRVDEV